MNDMTQDARRARWVLGGVLLLALLAGLAFLNPWLDSDGDNAGYLTLARSIAEGRGFTSINFPEVIPHTQYYPFYPLVLAPIVALFPGNWLLPKLPSLLFHLLFVAAVWIVFRNRARPGLWTAALLAAAVALNRQAAEHAAATMTESLYLGLSFAAIAFVEEREEKPRLGEGALAGVLLALAYLTKPIGITLVAAVALAMFLRGHRTAALAALLIALLTVFGWASRNDRVVTPANAFEHPLYGNVSYEAHVLARSSNNPDKGNMTAAEFVRKWGRLIRANLGPVANVTHPAYTVGLVAIGKEVERPVWFALPFIGLIFVGWFRCMRQRVHAGELYMLFYLGAASLYPAVRVRYVLPVMPLALYYFTRGSDSVIGWVRRKPAPVTGPAGPVGIAVLVTAVLLSILLLARQARYTLQDDFGPRGAENLYDRVDKGASAYVRAVAWINANAPRGAVIMDSKPWNSFLLSGHPTTSYPHSLNVAKALEVIRRHRADYVIEDGYWHWQSAKFLRSVIAAYPELFEVVHVEQGPETIVYRVNRAALPPAVRGAPPFEQRTPAPDAPPAEPPPGGRD